MKKPSIILACLLPLAVHGVLASDSGSPVAADAPTAPPEPDSEVQRVAFKALIDHLTLLNQEPGPTYVLLTLGYEMPGFGKQGDQVWEVRSASPAGLRAVFWVHARTKAVYYGLGAWKSPPP